jgi:diguanylate cyclase (GGDEF)-like protein
MATDGVYADAHGQAFCCWAIAGCAQGAEYFHAPLINDADSQMRSKPDTAASDLKLWREINDTRGRTRLGSAFYLVAWLAVWLGSSNPGYWLWPGVAGCVFFSLMIVLRWNHALPQQSREPMQRWLRRHWLMMHGSALAWGLCAAWTQLHDEFANARIIAILGTIGFSTVMALSLAMNLQRSMLAIFLVYLPPLAAMLWTYPAQQTELISLSIYLTYLMLAMRRSHGEHLASVALEQQLIEQRERFVELSRTDSLTGLGNRYQFNNLFPAMLAAARRQNCSFSLVLMDIDLFKKVNDEHGHSVGDACLQAFAESMRRMFRRDSDILLRLGGEEFGVLMPGTSLEQAKEIAEAFRLQLSGEPLQAGGVKLSLTSSLAAGSYDPAIDSSPEAFFARVDRALYQAKESGRNRLVLAAHDTAGSPASGEQLMRSGRKSASAPDAGHPDSGFVRAD